MVRVRRAIAAVVTLSLLASSCGGSPAPTLGIRDTITLSDGRGASRTIALHIDGEDGEALSRVRDAAVASLNRYTRWFGLPGVEGVSVTAASRRVANLEFTERTVVRQIVSLWWNNTESGDSSRQALRDGLIGYLSGFALEDVFNARYGVRGRTAEELRLFGGSIRWRFSRLALSRHVVIGADQPAQIERALLTVERLIGLTAMERGLHVALREWRQRRLTGEELMTIIGDAAGRNLAWVAEWMGEAYEIDYAIAEVSPTTILVRRTGVRLPIDVEVVAYFGDGQRASERWDGRDEVVSYEWESQAPIVAAEIDAPRIVAFDGNRLNNVLRRDTVSPVNATPWVVRWVGWIHNALLTYAVLL